MRRWVVSLLLISSVLPAFADEQAITLKPGDGHEETVNNCGACHSTDYIPMNSPFLTGEQWKAEVTKMRKVFGAPIDDTDAGKITGYLTAQYGAPATQ